MLEDRGVNKPFDRIVKSFADEAPLLFLRLLGIVPPGVEPKITPLRPETGPPIVLPDYVAALQVLAEEPFIFHCEFLWRFIAVALANMARYGSSLACQYNCHVVSILLLLHSKGVPDFIPEVAELQIGRTRLTHPFQVVRLWEIDPGLVLESNDLRLFPWVLLMKSTDEQVRRIGEILSRDGDEEMIARFLTLGSVRYDRKELEEMMGVPRYGLVNAILEGSFFVQEAVAEGEKRGIEQGLEQGLERGLERGLKRGRIEEARRMLRSALQAKFPGLDELAEIDQIGDIAKIEALLIETVIQSTDREATEAAIRAAK